MKNIAVDPITIMPMATANPREPYITLPSDFGITVLVSDCVVVAEAPVAGVEAAEVEPTISVHGEGRVLATPVQVEHPWGPPITTVN